VDRLRGPRFAVAALLIAALGGVSLAAQRLSPRDVDVLPSKPADARVAYGEDPLQFGDLRLPGSHFEIIAPTSDAFAVVRERILALLDVAR
jgi:hypothetical protein